MARARKYDLGDEELAARKANYEDSQSIDAGGGGGGDSLFLNWRSGASKAEVLTLWHQGMKMSPRIYFGIPMATDLEASGDKPARTALFFNRWTSHESNDWHRQLRFDKVAPSEPRCPMMRLVMWVDQHIGKLHDKVLFEFGRGCTDQGGKPSQVTQVTGDDLVGVSDNWRSRMTPQQSRLLIVVPVGGEQDGKVISYEPRPVIAEETFSLGKALLAEIKDASNEHGVDVADPLYSAAVYRWTYDKSAREKYGVRFNLRATEELSDEAFQAANDPIPQEVRDKVDEMLKPGDPQRLLNALQAALAYDLDLPRIMGVKPSDEPAKGNGARDEQAPQAASQGASRGSRGSKSKSKPAPEPKGEPCPECKTPWPEGLRCCPNPECDAEDDSIPADAPAGGDESGAVPPF